MIVLEMIESRCARRRLPHLEGLKKKSKNQNHLEGEHADVVVDGPAVVLLVQAHVAHREGLLHIIAHKMFMIETKIYVLALSSGRTYGGMLSHHTTYS